MKKFESIIFFNLLIGTQSDNFGTQNTKNWDPRIGTQNGKVGTQKFFILKILNLKFIFTRMLFALFIRFMTKNEEKEISKGVKKFRKII
jgi:hypothetical protein